MNLNNLESTALAVSTVVLTELEPGTVQFDAALALVEWSHSPAYTELRNRIQSQCPEKVLTIIVETILNEGFLQGYITSSEEAVALRLKGD